MRDTPSHYTLSFCEVIKIASVVYKLSLRHNFRHYLTFDLIVVLTLGRALTPLFGNGAGTFRIGKNSVVLIKIGKKYKVLCIEVLLLD